MSHSYVTVAFHNLGCKVNAYETDAMEQCFRDAGYQVVPFGEVADIYVINTCSVTNVADRKSRQMLHRAKKRNPKALVVAVGCYVQTAPEAVKADPLIDLAIGNNRKGDIVKTMEAFLQQKQEAKTLEARYDIVDIAQEKAYEDLFVSRIEGHTRAFLKVQDGCNQFCSYCIIPYARGRIRSRASEHVVQEVTQLAKQGIREVVLTGIHLSSYGLDCPKRQEGLLQLIQKVAAVDGVTRIRLGSLEPRIVTLEFARELSKISKLCPHFHLSLQSGCDKTLKEMNRHYTTTEYARCCEILRECFDKPAITTDVITGFPGETSEDFAQTEQYLRKLSLYELHVFPYSLRKGTRAATMPGHLPEQVKTERSAVLLAMTAKQSRAYRESFLGAVCSVLFEEKIELDGKAYYTGFTPEYIRVVVPEEEVFFASGQIGNVLLREMLRDDLVCGNLVE